MTIAARIPSVRVRLKWRNGSQSISSAARGGRGGEASGPACPPWCSSLDFRRSVCDWSFSRDSGPCCCVFQVRLSWVNLNALPIANALCPDGDGSACGGCPLDGRGRPQGRSAFLSGRQLRRHGRPPANRILAHQERWADFVACTYLWFRRLGLSSLRLCPFRTWRLRKLFDFLGTLGRSELEKFFGQGPIHGRHGKQVGGNQLHDFPRV